MNKTVKITSSDEFRKIFEEKQPPLDDVTLKAKKISEKKYSELSKTDKQDLVMIMAVKLGFVKPE